MTSASGGHNPVHVLDCLFTKKAGTDIFYVISLQDYVFEVSFVTQHFVTHLSFHI